MSIDLKHLTYDAYLAMPEMKQRYSILDGELMMAASPNPPHQTIVLEIAMKLTAFVRERQLGRVFVAPLDLDGNSVLSLVPRSLKGALTW